jgi:hypothetical protein
MLACAGVWLSAIGTWTISTRQRNPSAYAAAICHLDFFKVGIAESGNHEHATTRTTGANATYEIEANQKFARDCS